MAVNGTAFMPLVVCMVSKLRPDICCRQGMGGLPPSGTQQGQQPQLGQGRYGNAPQLQNLQVASCTLVQSLGCIQICHCAPADFCSCIWSQQPTHFLCCVAQGKVRHACIVAGLWV